MTVCRPVTLPHRRLFLAAAVTAAGLVAGCGGDGSPPPADRPVEPATLPATPTTTPSPAPATQLGELDLPTMPDAPDAATQPVASQPSVATTTQPSDLPTNVPPPTQVVESPDVPATQPTTEPVDPADLEPAPSDFGDLSNLSPGTDATGSVAAALAQFAAGTLSQPAVSPAAARQAEAVATLAVRLAPRDARLARQLVEARLAVTGIDSAIEALDHYRRLEPDDRLAQIRYVDLSAETLQSVDERLDYFGRLVETDSLPDEVRAHAALSSAVMLRERLEDAFADERIDRAKELDPFNPTALRLDYFRKLSTDASRPERVASLVALLRANVVQPEALAALAGELAAVGLVDEAGTYFQAASRAYAATGTQPPVAQLVDQTAALLIDNRPREASQLLTPMTQGATAVTQQAVRTNRFDDANYDAAVTSPLVAALGLKRLTSLEAQLSDLVSASNTSLRLLSVVKADMTAETLDAAVKELATSVEAGNVELPDMNALVAVATDNPVTRRPIVTTLTSRAWMDLYLSGQPTDAAILDAIEKLAGERSSLPARLNGWQAFRQGDLKTAREKLEAIADIDPLAKLGVLLIRKQEGQDVAADATALLRENPSGVVGATIADAFVDDGVRLSPGAEEAAQVSEALSQFPERLLDLIDPSKARSFYTLAARPAKVGHAYGEPLEAIITIRNVGSDPITVGPGGVLSSNIRIDSQVRGIIQERVPSAATDRWAGRTVLNPSERLEQTIRVDGPRLNAILAGNPHLSLTVFGEAVTNPTTALVPNPNEEGQLTEAYAVSAAGQAVPFTRVMDRRGMPLDISDVSLREGLQQRLTQLRDGTPLQQVRSADATVAQLRWLGGHLQSLQQQNAAADRMQAWQQLGGEMNESLQRAAFTAETGSVGESAVAAAWLTYNAAIVAPAEQREPLMRRLLVAPDPAVRLIGLLGTGAFINEAAEAMTQPLVDDEDATVRRMAKATLQLLAERPPAE